jgi:CheY-like chemotaxis protein
MPLVLVVDDDRGVREVLATMLTLDGHEVVEAVDGLEAKRALEGGCRPALILLDVMMPLMGGFDFRAWQLGSPYAHVPVLVVTAAPIDAEELAALEGCDLLPKPFGFSALIGEVRRCLGGAGAELAAMEGAGEG